MLPAYMRQKQILSKILLLWYQFNSDQIAQKDRAKQALSIGKKRNFFIPLLKEKSTYLTTFGMP